MAETDLLTRKLLAAASAAQDAALNLVEQARAGRLPPAEAAAVYASLLDAFRLTREATESDAAGEEVEIGNAEILEIVRETLEREDG